MSLSPDSLENNIYYWEGSVEFEKTTLGKLKKNNRDTGIYYNTLQKINNREWDALDLEKVSSTIPPIYSVRMTDEDRLLITTTTRNGKNYMLILEVVLNHDYKKAHFLQPKVLSRFLTKNEDIIWEKISADEAESLMKLVPARGKPVYKPLEFYNQDFIELTTDQTSVVSKSLPLVVTGIAGSGKSVVALTVLAEKRAENAAKGDMSPLLYVTKSDDLVREMQQKWAEFKSASDKELPPVRFMTYEGLVNTVPEFQGKELIADKKAFFVWHKAYVSQQKTIEKSKEKAVKKGGKQPESKTESIDELFTDTSKLYQEFRLMSGLNQEQYEALGKKQSLFESSARKELWKSFNAFKDSLPKNSVYLDFSPFILPEKYGLIVVDESQDLSIQELSNLVTNADSKVVLFMGTHQNLHDTLSKRGPLETIFSNSNFKPEYVNLKKAFRSPKSHTELMNALVNMKFHLSGGKTEKDEQTYINPSDELPEGNLNWLDSFPEDILQQAREQSASTQFVVICSENHHNEARKYFPTAIILTPQQSKGLEFKTVLLFRPFEESIYMEASDKLPKDVDYYAEPEKNINRAAPGKGEAKFTPAFNELFTACSRSTKNLLIYQPKEPKKPENPNEPQLNSRKLANFLNMLQNKGRKVASVNDIEWEKNDVESTPEAWIAAAKKLYKKNEEEAKRILTQHLDKKEEEIAAIFSLWSEPEKYSASLTTNLIQPKKSSKKIPNPVKAETRSSTVPEIKVEMKSETKITKKKKKKSAATKNTTPAITVTKPTKPILSDVLKSMSAASAPKMHPGVLAAPLAFDLNRLQSSPKSNDLSAISSIKIKTPKILAQEYRYYEFDSEEKKKFEQRQAMYIKLLRNAKNNETVLWGKIFSDTLACDLINTKVGEPPLSMLEAVIADSKLSVSLYDFLIDNIDIHSLLPEDFFLSHAMDMAKNDSPEIRELLALFLATKPHLLYANKPPLILQFAQIPHCEILWDWHQIITQDPFDEDALNNVKIGDFKLTDLFLPLSESDSITTAFSNLCESEEGVNFIYCYLTTLPGWMQLKEIQSALFDSKPSSFSKLIVHHSGMELLIEYLKNETNRLKFSVEAFRELVDSGTTVLRHMVGNDTGIILLNLILEEFPLVFTAEDIFTIQNKHSVFFYLLKEDNQGDLTLPLFKNNPDLIKGITRENLFEMTKERETYQESVLFLLLDTPELKEITASIFKENPALFDNINLEKLTAISYGDINKSMLFERVINFSPELAQLFMSSNSADTLLKNIDPKTKEPYICKLLRKCSSEQFNIIIKNIKIKSSQAELLTEIAAWRADSKTAVPLVKKNIKNSEREVPLSKTATEKQKHGFFQGASSGEQKSVAQEKNQGKTNERKGKGF